MSPSFRIFTKNTIAVVVAVVTAQTSFAQLPASLRLMLQPQERPQPGQTAPARKINIVILDGEGAINNIRQRVAREPIVQVEDENRRPIAGAIVTFATPNQGPSAVFANGSNTTTIVTDATGRAAARGLTPNGAAGDFQIRVSVSHEGLTANTTITQTNLLAAAAAGGISGKVLTILLVAGGAAAGGAAYALSRGSDSSPAATRPPGTVLTPGAPIIARPGN